MIAAITDITATTRSDPPRMRSSAVEPEPDSAPTATPAGNATPIRPQHSPCEVSRTTAVTRATLRPGGSPYAAGGGAGVGRWRRRISTIWYATPTVDTI